MATSYRDVIAAITRDIRSGRYPVGSPIRTTAQLMADHATTQTTVRRAVKALVDAGVLVGHRGHAVTVARVPDEDEPRARTVEQRLADIERRLDALERRPDA